MSLILHLSDLHLGSPSDWQLDYTDKFGLKRAAGDTKIDHMRRTLSALDEALQEAGKALDAIVVSGDLTNANREDGYAEFESLLDELGSSRPTQSRILVVPGNHDADWTVQPGNAAKFRRFLNATRADYHTPLVSGLDYDDSELVRRTGSRRAASPVLELGEAAVLALNSADYCGVEEEKTKTPWLEVIRGFRAGDPGGAATKARETASKELRSLRVQDMARVDKRQPDALLERMKGTALEGPVDDQPRLRIAVLHHPIGPVSDREEIKAFEGLTNLDQVRSFLFHSGIHVVLHGHKHASYLGWDWLLPAGDDLDAVPRRTLVVGSPGDFRPGKTVCRLLEVCPDDDRPVPGAPRLRVIDIRGAKPGQPLKLDFHAPCHSLAQPFVRSPDKHSPWVVRATTADAAYQQLRDLPADIATPRQVVSVVEDASSARRLPANYPEPHDDAWLRNVAKWWQLADPQATRAFVGSEFNHGQRLYGEDRGNSIRKAARALPSSKAFAILIDATEAGSADREFPALTGIQLLARTSESNGTYLDVIGIYRKQDLDLWWPVNMCELADVQQIALESAAQNSSLDAPINAGRLIAVATIGLHDTVLPQMAGTTLDRAIDLDPDRPHRLAYLAAQPNPETQREWVDALLDVGEQDGDKVLVPSIGLDRLRAALEMHRQLGDAPSGFSKVVKAVEALGTNAQQAVQELGGSPTGQTRDYWGSRLRADRDDVLKALRSVVRSAKIEWT